MKAKTKKTPKESSQVASFQPGIVAFLIAVIASLSVLLLAYLGVIFSN